MNNNNLNEELKRIDENYQNSFNKINEINNMSDNSVDLWGQKAMNDFAQKMGEFTNEMVNLQNVFGEYENEVSGITEVNEKLESMYGKRK